MGKFKIGDKVRFIDSDKHEQYPEYYPEVGTIGEIQRIDDAGDPWVQWPAGTTSYSDCWCCNPERVELVTEGGGPDA